MEAAVCEWLVVHGIAHRHASEVFTVSARPTGAPGVYVPDIVLHDKTNDGRTIIIEPVHSYSPKGRGTKIVAAFRRQMKKKYFMVIVAKKHYMHKIPRNAYDILIDFDRLDMLAENIPWPDR
jgi:hypothetical protein